jgi:hypothetical protein
LSEKTLRRYQGSRGSEGTATKAEEEDKEFR